jgi:hypothetical protein
MSHETALLSYVVLHHTGVDNAHYDLMYESAPGSALTTWRLPIWPVTAATPIERLPDHRRDYLTYEGPVSNNRGQVARVASGDCQIEAPDPRTFILHLDSPVTHITFIQSGPNQWTAHGQ